MGSSHHPSSSDRHMGGVTMHGQQKKKLQRLFGILIALIITGLVLVYYTPNI